MRNQNKYTCEFCGRIGLGTPNQHNCKSDECMKLYKIKTSELHKIQRLEKKAEQARKYSIGMKATLKAQRDYEYRTGTTISYGHFVDKIKRGEIVIEQPR